MTANSPDVRSARERSRRKAFSSSSGPHRPATAAGTCLDFRRNNEMNNESSAIRPINEGCGLIDEFLHLDHSIQPIRDVIAAFVQYGAKQVNASLTQADQFTLSGLPVHALGFNDQCHSIDGAA